MSEQEPKDTKEWEAYADAKFEEIKTIIKDIEKKGSSLTVEENIRDASKGFGDMLVSMGALAYKISSEVTQKATGETAAAFQQDLVKKTDEVRNIIADEIDKVSSHLRSEVSTEKESKSQPDTEETSK